MIRLKTVINAENEQEPVQMQPSVEPLKPTGSSPNFKFDSFCVGVMATVGCKEEGTIRKMN